MGISQEFGSLSLLFRTQSIAAEDIHRLWGETEVSHYGDARTDDAAYHIGNLCPTLYLHAIATCLFHDAYCIAYTIIGSHLIATEGHIADHKGTFDSSYHRTSIDNHLIDGDRECSGIASHDIRSGIANEDGINASTIDNTCHRKIVRGEHGNFLTFLFHFL